MKTFTAALLACAFLAGSAIAQTAQAKLDSGMIQGAVADGVASYKGIPFAAPPVGALRWRAPQPVKAWSGVKKTTAYAPDCMQVPFPSDAAPLGTEPKEDCLYANVWEPAGTAPGAKLAVLVWIYGGGSVNGGASPDVYSGEHLAKKGIILVSFNYRLGRFGFFGHPALTAENADNGLLGNYAYMDQIAALKWVQKNAAAFGGDASNVTILGESAGGRSVHTLLGTSLANGLFVRAIVESGGGRNAGLPSLSGSTPVGQRSAEETGVLFAESVGVKGTGKDALAKLRALPAETIRGNLNMATSRANYFSGNMVDGRIVLASQNEQYLAGSTMKVPLMIGTNSADAGAAVADSEAALFASFGPLEAEAKAAYLGDGTKDLAQLKGEVGRDRGQIEPTRYVAKTYALRGLPTYVFRVSYVAASMRDKWKTGVPHATELPFVFGTVRAKYGAATTAADEKASDQIMTYWANFAKTGDPNCADLPAWPKYDPAKDNLMNFTMDNGPVAMQDPFHKRLDVTEKFDTQIPLPPVVAPVVPPAASGK
jgi:para-nitrobenzyl esterase